MKKKVLLTLIITSPIILLFIIRHTLPTQLDDVTPGIPCEEELLQKADIYYIIPNYNNTPLHKEWCENIQTYNKTLAMHGITHTYKEFSQTINKEEFNNETKKFETCLGTKPTSFKPGHLAWNKENNWIKKEYDVELQWNQLFHKVYHCQDKGRIPNWIITLY